MPDSDDVTARPDRGLPATELAELRSRAVAVAYRMVGSRSEAEDIAQDTMVKVQAAAAREELRSAAAFTTTVATRLAIDHLRSARVRREEYVGPWLPEPLSAIGADDTAAAAELADSLSFAMLVVLESLGPLERAAFLLHDTFGYGYDELSRILDRSPAACRQLVSRARRRIADDRPPLPTDPQEHRELLGRFVAAARSGDLAGLVDVLAPDAVVITDGGANMKAARHPIRGRDRVSRFMHSIGPRIFDGFEVELTDVNGQLGFVAWDGEAATLVGTIEVADGKIVTVRSVRNPDKLRWFRRS